MLTLILGGARSGKSRLAQHLANSAARVTYVATARPGEDAVLDAEMSARIAHHRASRPAWWQTIEEPLDLAAAVERAAIDAEVILVDCLTIWLSNIFWAHRDDAPQEIEHALHTSLGRISATAQLRHVILVSNELGSGTVPEFAVTRSFRDVQGLLNQWAAAAADQVILTVAGLPLYLKRPGESIQ